MIENSNLVDFERGSAFGGIMTAIVFIGFIALLVYDLSYNISNKPYTFEVRDKFMSPEEHMATNINLGDYQISQELVLGFIATHENGTRDTSFNPFDNDYIEIISGYMDFDLSKEKGVDLLYMHEGPELELCSKERMIEMMGFNMEYYRKNYICLKNKTDITIYSNVLQDRAR